MPQNPQGYAFSQDRAHPFSRHFSKTCGAYCAGIIARARNHSQPPVAGTRLCSIREDFRKYRKPQPDKYRKAP